MTIVLGIVLGLALGVAHVAALRANVRLYLARGACARVVALHLVRTVVTVGGLLLAARGGAGMLLAATGAFTASGLAAARWWRP